MDISFARMSSMLECAAWRKSQDEPHAIELAIWERIPNMPKKSSTSNAENARFERLSFAFASISVDWRALPAMYISAVSSRLIVKPSAIRGKTLVKKGLRETGAANSCK